MKKPVLLLTFVYSFSLLFLAMLVQAQERESSSPPLSNHPIDLILRRALTRSVLNTSNQAVVGPLACTSFGDPWSPLVYTWPGSSGLPHTSTYHYRIRVPADYPYDIVRVELFDPDSMNQAANTATVAHTQVWIDSGRPSVENLSCSNPVRQGSCLIDTQEDDLLGLPLDLVNPWWFMRIDENRFGDGSGSGCNTPGTYSPAYNTQTLYQLYYYRDIGGGTPIRNELAVYTGQVGDGVRDTGDHQTDLRWVSPGGAQSYDQPVFVPVDAGSPGTFEVSLSQDLIDVVTDPATGDRYIYLDITAVSGSSENGFEIWAGPNIYINSLSSDVNVRNVQLINEPAAQYGIEVFAQDYLPLNSNYSNWTPVPLAEIGPEYAGQTISVSLFDPDSGAQPPVVFYMDSLAFVPDPANSQGDGNYYIDELTDWALAFGVTGVPDPDGGTGRCVPGACNNQWISPTYQIQLPALTSACDPTNPDPMVCTPFYGGHLMAYYRGGGNDLYQWEIIAPEAPPLDSSAGCDAFPISPYLDIRSLTAVTYPPVGDFEYPASPPDYSDFPNNVPDVLLTEAQEGYIYLVEDAASTGNLGWLLWNNGIITSATTLENSLIWPGNSWDYTDHGDPGVPATPLYPHVVRGYVNPINNLDLSMHIGDWVPTHSGVNNSAGIRDALETHIDLPGRTLRLPVWGEATGTGPTLQYGIAGFANFQLLGYRVSPAEPWLLVKFIDWDTSCGQVPQAPVSVAISGPVISGVGVTNTFTAVTAPYSTTLPITYTWQATDQSTITQTGGLVDDISYTWATTGTKTITVTASNAIGTVTDSHTLEVAVGFVDLTIGELTVVTNPVYSNQPVQAQVVITNAGTTDLDTQFFVDLFFDPAEVYSDHIPLTYSVGYTAVVSLAAGESQPAILTAPAGFPTPGEHVVYAMVESGQTVGESNEFNNITGPLTVTVLSPSDLTIGNLVLLNQPPILINEPILGQVTITNTGDLDVSSQFFVDIYFDPPVVYTDHIPIEYSVGYTAVGYLAAGSSQVITLTAPVGFDSPGEHQIYAMVDSLQAVDEDDETNNITGPLTVTVELEPVAITAVSLEGPTLGVVNETYTFTAAISPITAAQPITYIWAVNGTVVAIVPTGGISSTLGFAWATPGTYTLTVTADNGIASPVTATHIIVIEAVPPAQWQIYLPVVIRTEAAKRP